jgi:hypothetical protein
MIPAAFQRDSTIHPDATGNQFCEIWMLGPLGRFIRALRFPLASSDFVGDDLSPETQQQMELVVAWLNHGARSHAYNISTYRAAITEGCEEPSSIDAIPDYCYDQTAEVVP